MTLMPFWNYFGAKWRAASLYPAPQYDTIVEPFAGAAGYALNHHDRRVVLVDLDETIASVWNYLIHVSESEIMSIPIVDYIDDLWHVSHEARLLVGLLFADGFESPRKHVSPSRRARGRGSKWNERRRFRIANQLRFIRHWRVLHGSYAEAPDVVATWFIDPPYQKEGYAYKCSARSIDFSHLGMWCRSRIGQTIVCENDGADWLPFRHHETIRARAHRESAEAIWDRASSSAEWFARSGMVLR